MRDLAGWLTALSTQDMARILEIRPDAMAPPTPRSVRELAGRLSSPVSITEVALSLPRPAVQAAEAILALGDGCSRIDLAASMEVEPDDEGLDDALAMLAAAALVWPDGNRFRTVPMGHIWPEPLRLGDPIAELLSNRSADDLRRTAKRIGAPVGRLKKQIVTDLAAWLSHASNVRSLVGTASPLVRDILLDIAWNGPSMPDPDRSDYSYLELRQAQKWGAERGLLVEASWGGLAEMPREVALRLRGEGYRVPFEPVPPVVSLVAAPASVESEAAAAAADAVAQVAAVVNAAGRSSIALLKSGGVGARELRKLSKAIGDSEQRTRFWIELAAGAGLVAPTELGVLPTEASDEWLGAEPADRLAALLDAWRELRCLPLLAWEPQQRPPALSPSADGWVATVVRPTVVSIALSFPLGKGVTGGAMIRPQAAWRLPLVAEEIDDLPAVCAAVWDEAELLGAVARGAPSDLARAMFGGAITDVAGRYLPKSRRTARFQADLTAVVVGAASADIAELLNIAADPESRGAASTWRFSAASVRRALDTGMTGDELLAALRDRAEGGLPQPLEYLVRDVARRHGAVRVREVACCLRSDDPALLAELLRSRALESLELSALAPTVIASAKPVADTLAALRAAGYAPVGEVADGAPLIERTARPRAVPVETPRGQRAVPELGTPDPVAVAAAILAGGSGADDDEDAGGTESWLRPALAHLSLGELRLLAHAIDTGGAVRIEYVNAQGRASSRIITEIQPDGHLLHAWCMLRQDDRVFSLPRIVSVSPAAASRAGLPA